MLGQITQPGSVRSGPEAIGNARNNKPAPAISTLYARQQQPETSASILVDVIPPAVVPTATARTRREAAKMARVVSAAAAIALDTLSRANSASKVRTAQDTVLYNVQAGKPDGKCNRKETAGGNAE